MEDGKRWITYKGRRLLVNENGQIVKPTMTEEEKEKYFNKNYNIQFNKWAGEKYWDEEKKGYIFEPGIVSKTMAVYNNKTKEQVAYLTYNEVYDKSKRYDRKYYPNKINVYHIHTRENYRREGIATQLYKNLQKEAGKEDIYFGKLSSDGKKLIKKIGKITNQKTDDENNKYYWGRINL